jgi:hypothetical protein
MEDVTPASSLSWPLDIGQILLLSLEELRQILRDLNLEPAGSRKTDLQAQLIQLQVESVTAPAGKTSNIAPHAETEPPQDLTGCTLRSRHASVSSRRSSHSSDVDMLPPEFQIRMRELEMQENIRKLELQQQHELLRMRECEFSLGVSAAAAAASAPVPALDNRISRLRLRFV